VQWLILIVQLQCIEYSRHLESVVVTLFEDPPFSRNAGSSETADSIILGRARASLFLPEIMKGCPGCEEPMDGEICAATSCWRAFLDGSPPQLLALRDR
jgi:hypothetical protein